MENISSVDEILEFAISREVEANQLYIRMAKSIENPEMRDVCEDLAKEELEHKAKLELEVMKRGEVVQDFDVSNYMMDFGNETDMDYEQLLLFAIKKEQISIDLYNDLATIVKDEESREVLLMLAKEETEHKQRFEIEYGRIKTKT
ncbi:MAG: ferritin family protein [Planctomycetota bacterium]|jgi:rubrerythrin